MTDTMLSLDQIIGQLEQKDLKALTIQTTDALPQRARDFIDTLEQQFADTVARARQKAMLLRQVADELDKECDELEKAGYNLPVSIEKWILFERNTINRVSSFALVNPVHTKRTDG